MTTIDVTTQTTSTSPYVAVALDRDNQRAIIGLDSAAVDGLLSLIELADLHDLSQNPGSYGIDQDTADLITAVGYAIKGPLQKLQGF